jgi:hypothetical protein
MAHVRKLIRHAAAALLKDNIAGVADRVLTGRRRALTENHKPTILVYFGDEEAERTANGRPPPSDRTATLYIEIRVQDPEEVDDKLDDIAEAVEKRIGATQKFGGLASDTLYRGQDTVAQVPGTTIVAGMRLNYRVRYRVPEGNPTHDTGDS